MLPGSTIAVSAAVTVVAKELTMRNQSHCVLDVAV